MSSLRWSRVRWSAVLLTALAGLTLAGWRNSRAEPVVRTATIALADWPTGASPLRVLLLADLHLGNGSTDAARLARVVDQVDGLRPDLILLAGDLVAGYGAQAAASQAGILRAQLGRLHPPLGIVAVMGNHDNETDPALLARTLRDAGATVVENGAVRRGPLLIGGSGDTVSGHAKLGGTLNALRRLTSAAPGARIYLSHSPDIVRWLTPGPSLLLAGHTHCGQVVVPLLERLMPVSTVNGNRYRCGLIRDGARTVIVTAGIGTSNVPLRFGAPPDMWLLTLGPVRAPDRRPPPRPTAAAPRR